MAPRWNRRARRGRPRPGLRRKMRLMRRNKRLHTARNSVGHLFKRVAYSENYISVSSGGAPKTFGSLTFQLSDLPNYTEFTELYDLYKINKVKVELIPKINSATLNGSAQMPIIHTTVDSNDSTPPAALTELMENEDLKTTRGTSIHKRYFTPKCQLKLYESIATDGYATARRNPFINTADPTVPHYALKWCLENPISGGEVYWYCDMKVTYYIACREVQ